MHKHTTSTAIPISALKAEALASMSASFDRFCLAAGLETLSEMLEQDATAACGERHERGERRQAHRWGRTKGKIGFHGGKVEIERPRVRGLDGAERVLPSWQNAVSEDLLGKWAMNQMLINVSTRRFKRSVRLPEGDVPASDGAGLSKSATSRRFVALSAARMKAWMETRLDDLDLLAIRIHIDEDMLLVAAIGVDANGHKHPLGLVEGATENATTVQALIDNLIERGLDPTVRRLFIIDGAKALSKAIRRTFGRDAAIQRGQIRRALGAVDLLIEKAGAGLGLVQRGDDEARIGLAVCPFRLGDDPAPARPAVERRITEVPEAASGLAGRGRLRLGLQEFDADLFDQPRIASEPEDEVHPVRLAPGHQRLAGEPRVGAQQDARSRPTPANLRDDARHFLNRAGAGVDVRRPELGRQQMPAAEHVKRQVAVAIIVAVKEAAFLIAVQRVVRGVEVEDDLLGRPVVRLEQQVDEQGLDRRGLMCDLAVLRGPLARQFEPVQRRFARHRRAILAPGLELARQHRHQRVVTKLVVIVQILVAERNAEHALPDERGD